MTPELVRLATPADEAAINRVLAASYGSMTAEYGSDLLAAVLPAMTAITTAVLNSGSFYVVAVGEELAGVGGWTFERPGGAGEAIDPQVAHMRFVAVDPAHKGRGVGRLIVERSAADARTAGAAVLHTYSTLGAERFYAGLGFERLGPMDNVIRGHALPSVHMVRRLG